MEPQLIKEDVVVPSIVQQQQTIPATTPVTTTAVPTTAATPAAAVVASLPPPAALAPPPPQPATPVTTLSLAAASSDSLPSLFPALVAPREVFYRIPFKVQLYVRVGDKPGPEEVAQAVMQGMLSTKCFREGETEATCNGVVLRFCPRCQTEKLVEVMGVRETVGPELLQNGSIYRFTFDQCRSFCTSSRLHLRANLVLGLAVRLQGPCIVYSNPISLMSKIVRRGPGSSAADSVMPAGSSAVMLVQNKQKQPNVAATVMTTTTETSAGSVFHQKQPMPPPVAIATTGATTIIPGEMKPMLPSVNEMLLQQQQQRVAMPTTSSASATMKTMMAAIDDDDDEDGVPAKRQKSDLPSEQLPR